MDDREILLKINRMYSKYEAVGLLNIEIGKLRAYCHELEDANKVLSGKLSSIKKELENTKDEIVFKLPKADRNGYYVTLKRFQKQVKLTEYFIDLYHKVKPKSPDTIVPKTISQ